MKSNIAKWAVWIAVICWGAFNFLILAGEDSPNEPMPLGIFVMLKSGAMANMYLCYKACQWLHKKGLLPEYVKREIEMEDEEI